MAHRTFSTILALTMSAFLTGGASAAPKPIRAVPKLEPVRDDVSKEDARVRKLLPPATRAKAEAAAKTFAARPLEKMTEAAVADEARKESAKLLVTTSSNITALAFLVLMEAAKAAREDMKAIMGEVKKLNAEREKLRESIEHLAAKTKPKKSPKPAYLKKLTTAKTPNLQLAYTVLPNVSAVICESKADDLCLDELKQKEDALSEMGEMESLRLQMAMDRTSKMMSTLSNLLKKSSETADAIISNLK